MRRKETKYIKVIYDDKDYWIAKIEDKQGHNVTIVFTSPSFERQNMFTIGRKFRSTITEFTGEFGFGNRYEKLTKKEVFMELL